MAAISDKPLVFVSCGQSTEAERKLGKEVCELIRRVRPDVEPYFADEDSTVAGLSATVLKALHEAAGFICVMHARGTFGGMTRGSVWIEQEIAIAAFMNHQLGRKPPILFYKEDGIGDEGIRKVLLLNPARVFSNDQEVLDDLGAKLRTFRIDPYREYDLEPQFAFKFARNAGMRDYYRLSASVSNVGRQRVTEFRLRVWFPRALLESQQAREQREFSNSREVCLELDGKELAPQGLYPQSPSSRVLASGRATCGQSPYPIPTAC